MGERQKISWIKPKSEEWTSNRNHPTQPTRANKWTKIQSTNIHQGDVLENVTSTCYFLYDCSHKYKLVSI